MIDRHGFALGDTVNVDKLRKDVADMILREELLRFVKVELIWRGLLARRQSPIPVVE